jgi:hypothetical protein
MKHFEIIHMSIHNVYKDFNSPSWRRDVFGAHDPNLSQIGVYPLPCGVLFDGRTLLLCVHRFGFCRVYVF